MSKATESCPSEALQLDPSAYAKRAGYNRPSSDRRLAATTKSGRNPLAAKGQGPGVLEDLTEHAARELADAFPGPLILPGDELAHDPKYPPQSFRSWLNEGLRKNRKLNKNRKTLYVASVPEITSSMYFMKGWLQPDAGKGGKSSASTVLTSPPVEDIIKYTAAFYHGMPVKPFPHHLQFVPWTESKKSGKPGSDTNYIGLLAGNGCTRIRARPCPDGIFKRQLNLEDLLDAAIEMLPSDAYSIILLFDHDMYEDEEDDFCCGRAYGGNRVAVVSTARYHPALDAYAGIDLAHMWPASHCKSYVNDVCAAEGLKPDSAASPRTVANPGPLLSAVEAVKRMRESLSPGAKRGLWFSRLARTIVHELGHCLGLDHCIYYACVMQSTSCMAEDVRQPPYLCPVCLSKVSHAIAYELEGRNEIGKEHYIVERYRSLEKFCDSWNHVGLFAGYGAWLRGRLNQVELRTC
ncbi:hypothetical protein F5Y13DRAFT_167102 [Hypoxylon sp. FL1857]|nr:hypothetical protein F5Y13DRAFT_167102 [Hypoxylon sp. FL1857]